MNFLSSFIVVMVMFLLPIIKVRIPLFERKMAVKELLNVFKLLVQTIQVECFQFWNFFPEVAVTVHHQNCIFYFFYMPSVMSIIITFHNFLIGVYPCKRNTFKNIFNLEPIDSTYLALI